MASTTAIRPDGSKVATQAQRARAAADAKKAAEQEAAAEPTAAEGPAKKKGKGLAGKGSSEVADAARRGGDEAGRSQKGVMSAVMTGFVGGAVSGFAGGLRARERAEREAGDGERSLEDSAKELSGDEDFSRTMGRLMKNPTFAALVGRTMADPVGMGREVKALQEAQLGAEAQAPAPEPERDRPEPEGAVHEQDAHPEQPAGEPRPQLETRDPLAARLASIEAESEGASGLKSHDAGLTTRAENAIEADLQAGG